MAEQEEIRHPDGRIEHPAVRFETRDASFPWAVGLFFGAVGLSALGFYLLWFFFTEYRSYQATIKKSPFPLAAQPNTAPPVEPRLEQVDRLMGVESNSVYQRQLEREKKLHAYGPTPEKGYVHVPIEQAMKHLADKLPARKESPKDEHKANGLVDAGESNSGRMFRKEARWYER
jgi:hypothetical protein